MTKWVFLEEIEFENNFPPFKKLDKLSFCWEKEVQNLIEFYLKNKPKNEGKSDKEIEKNTKRFKINCVLGNNWGGKSRLFEGIINKKEELIIRTIDWHMIMLDDMFLLSQFNYFKPKNWWNYSINNYLFSGERPTNATNKLNSFIWHFFKIEKEFKDELYALINAFFWWELQEINYYFDLSYKDNSYKNDEYKNNINVIYDLTDVIKLSNLINNYGKNEFTKDQFDKDNRAKYVKFFTKNNKNNKVDINLYKWLSIFIAKDILENIYNEDVNIDSYINNLWLLWIEFVFNDERKLKFSSMSAGEKMILIRFINILWKILKNKEKQKFVILIDEPDLHLHLDWQRQYIQKLIDVFSTLDTNIKLHFIIATHSPFVISDLPTECIVKLEGNWKEENWKKYTKVTDWWGNEFNDEEELSEKKTGKWTFWANFVDLIKNWFFFDTKKLMWSFAEEVIDKVAQIEKDEIIKGEKLEDVSEIKKKLKNKIWDSFLRDNLLYFKKSDKDAKN